MDNRHTPFSSLTHFNGGGIGSSVYSSGFLYQLYLADIGMYGRGAVQLIKHGRM
ncbi:MAG: hypothetical protein LE179_04935 [Endomicrobium sp.]|nr:hypothetical protein [Endomicrobium sp.]